MIDLVTSRAAGAFLAQAAEPAPEGRGGGMDLGTMLLALLPIVILFWWLSRSQKKKEKDRQDVIAALKKGDKVVTVGGIHGEIIRLNEREAVLMVDKSKGIELRFQRSAIATPLGSKAGGPGTELDDARLEGEGGGKS